jgi:hypothetical protein
VITVSDEFGTASVSALALRDSFVCPRTGMSSSSCLDSNIRLPRILVSPPNGWLFEQRSADANSAILAESYEYSAQEPNCLHLRQREVR